MSRLFEALQGFDIEKHGVGYHDKRFEFNKWTCNDMKVLPHEIRDFIWNFSARLVGEDDRLDPDLWGAGVHCIKEGGYLAMHRDFTVLPTTYRYAAQYRRVVNYIFFLTPEQFAGKGGELRIKWPGKKGEKRIKPFYSGKEVSFDPQLLHGHPDPLKGWKAPRWSIAVYLYRQEFVDESKWLGTRYEKLPWMDDSPEYQQARLDRADIMKRYSKYLP